MAGRPLCAYCQRAPATQCDHIIPVADGGALFDRANLQPLCQPCHDTKTRRENSDRQRRRAAERAAARRQLIEHADTDTPDTAQARNDIIGF